MAFPAVQPNEVNPPLGYGLDLTCITDLTSTMGESSGRTLLAESCARRLQTDRGQLLDDPDYGYNIVGELDADVSTVDLARIASQVDEELVKDERLLASTTVATFVSGALTLTISLTDKNGKFALVLLVNDVTVEILKVL